MDLAAVIFPLFLVGALAGLAAERLARQFSGAATGWRRLGISALLFGALAAGYWYFLSTSAEFSTLDRRALVSGYAVRMVSAFVMLTISLTDFDLLMIPDLVMIPATLLAVAAMTAFDAELPVRWVTDEGVRAAATPLTALPPWLMPGARTMTTVSILCWLFWCFALLDRRFYANLGVRRAVYLFCRRLVLSRLTWVLAGLAFFGTAAISLLACHAPDYLPRLFSSLIGLAVAMILVWTVRLVGGVLLGREAMGFGDVVLMGFIGAITGWQGGVAVFFLAPFAGIFFGLARAAFRTKREIPYGPFLCLATVALYFFWGPIWRAAGDLFSAPMIVLILAAVCLVTLVILLGIIRLLRVLF